MKCDSLESLQSFSGVCDANGNFSITGNFPNGYRAERVLFSDLVRDVVLEFPGYRVFNGSAVPGGVWIDLGNDWEPYNSFILTGVAIGSASLDLGVCFYGPVE